MYEDENGIMHSDIMVMNDIHKVLHYGGYHLPNLTILDGLFDECLYVDKKKVRLIDDDPAIDLLLEARGL